MNIEEKNRLDLLMKRKITRGGKMAKEIRFVVEKKAKEESITYMEYEKLKGYDVKPKNNIKFEDMINVNKMVIINPSLTKKLVDKKCHRTLEKIIKMLSYIYEDDSGDDAPLHLVLDEIAKFKSLIIGKYKEYMEEEENKLLLKKLEILEAEVKLRLNYIYQQNEIYEEKKGKKGR